MKNACRTTHAFSLVELSIVLVILGLLTGGILAGQSLIRAAELRSVTTEYTRYITALRSFQDRYFTIPGDFAMAQSFWVPSAACPCGTGTAAAGVCNGDGNMAVNNYQEVFGFWEHMAYAGLIEGSYTGCSNIANATSMYQLAGGNVPQSKLSGAGWLVYALSDRAANNVGYFEGAYGNSLMFGVVKASSAFDVDPIISAPEAWNIDTKMDDGRPGIGMMRTFEWNAKAAGDAAACSNPVASNTVEIAASSTYAVDQTARNCAFIFRMN